MSDIKLNGEFLCDYCGCKHVHGDCLKKQMEDYKPDIKTMTIDEFREYLKEETKLKFKKQ